MIVLQQAVRELGRRVVRTLLTAIGIAIGVAALVMLGALAEKLGRLLEGGRQFATGQITVTSAGSGSVADVTRGGLISGEQLAAMRRVAGVSAVAPIVMFPLTESPSRVPFTLSPLVFGVDMQVLLNNESAPPPVLAAGRMAVDPERDEVVIGSQVARLYEAGIGSTIEIRGRPFTVVGILEPTLTGPDSFVFVPFATASRLLIDSEPMLRRLVMTPGASVLPLATSAAVFWRRDADPEVVARRLHEEVPNVSVVSPAEASRQLGRAMAISNGLMLGSAVVALLVASLAVANTMFTAVVERRREIGLRRVVGATRGQVIGQLVTEAALVGVVGSVLGTVAGAIGAAALNVVTERMGAPIFLVSGRLVAVALLGPTLLAAAAGLWPAWRASRLSPTEAVRYA